MTEKWQGKREPQVSSLQPGDKGLSYSWGHPHDLAALRAPALSTPMVGIKFQHEFCMGKFTVAVLSPDWRSDSQETMARGL